MPLSKDPEGGGTEADGSKSAKYCSYCYKDGKFITPDMTVEEMMALVEGKMKEMHIPGFMAKSIAKSTPKLERWSGVKS
jgi:hypothetical protein